MLYILYLQGYKELVSYILNMLYYEYYKERDLRSSFLNVPNSVGIAN
jgi:hypothetical protein